MSTEKLNTEVRREQIAQAALHLVASQGLKNLSVAGVARRVGLVPSAIYRHFKSKDDILDTVLELIQDRLLGNVSAVRTEITDPIEALRQLLVRHVRFIRENEAIPRIVFSEDVYGGRPERKAQMYKIISGYLNQVRDIIRRGQQDGYIRADVPPDTLSVMFLGLIQPAAILWHLSEGQFDATKHAERAWKVFSDAIKTR